MSLVPDRNESIYAIANGSASAGYQCLCGRIAVRGGAPREVLRRALSGRYTPLFGNALWSEYEDVLARPLWTSVTTAAERRLVVATLAHQGQWVSVYYGWRPNLRDEGDNHLIELAVAGSAAAVVTHNVGDMHSGEMAFPDLRIVTPAECLEVFP